MAANNSSISGSLDPVQVRAELDAITRDRLSEAAEQIVRLPIERQVLYFEELLESVRTRVSAPTWWFIERLLFAMENRPAGGEYPPEGSDKDAHRASADPDAVQ